MNNVLLTTCLLPTPHGLFHMDVHRTTAGNIPVLRSRARCGDDVPVCIHDATFSVDSLATRFSPALEKLASTGGLLICAPPRTDVPRTYGEVPGILAHYGATSVELLASDRVMTLHRRLLGVNVPACVRRRAG